MRVTLVNGSSDTCMGYPKLRFRLREYNDQLVELSILCKSAGSIELLSEQYPIIGLDGYPDACAEGG